MEGPRALGASEWEGLRALTDAVFRPGLTGDYPQLFQEENRENLRVCVDAGRCVSHVGMIERGVVLFGCPVQVCCIGAVCTDPASRGRGLASACFDDAARKAGEDGVDLMLVSGDRSLYRRRGCLRVGGDAVFTLTPALAASAEARERLPVTVEAMTDADLAGVMDCYRAEPVRFVRPPDDYHHARRSATVMDRPSAFWVVRERGDLRGYLIVERGDRSPQVQVLEFAGDRRALLAALPQIARRHAPAGDGWAEVRWQVSRHDRLFHSLCVGAGLEPAPGEPPWTVTLINFESLMERMRPRWEELLGRRDADRLAFRQEDGQYAFGFGDDVRHLDRDAATRLLFDPAAVSGLPPGRCAEVLTQILPLPGVWTGINYV